MDRTMTNKLKEGPSLTVEGTIERRGDAYNAAIEIIEQLQQSSISPGFILIFPALEEPDVVRVISNMDNEDAQSVMSSMAQSMRLYQAN